MLPKSCPDQQKQSVLPQSEFLSALANEARSLWGDRVSEVVDEYPETPWLSIDVDDGCVVLEAVEGFIQVHRDFSLIARAPIGPDCVEKLWPLVCHYVEAQL